MTTDEQAIEANEEPTNQTTHETHVFEDHLPLLPLGVLARVFEIGEARRKQVHGTIHPIVVSCLGNHYHVGVSQDHARIVVLVELDAEVIRQKQTMREHIVQSIAERRAAASITIPSEIDPETGQELELTEQQRDDLNTRNKAIDEIEEFKKQLNEIDLSSVNGEGLARYEISIAALVNQPLWFCASSVTYAYKADSEDLVGHVKPDFSSAESAYKYIMGVSREVISTEPWPPESLISDVAVSCLEGFLAFDDGAEADPTEQEKCLHSIFRRDFPEGLTPEQRDLFEMFIQVRTQRASAAASEADFPSAPLSEVLERSGGDDPNAEETDKKVDADSLDEPESQPSESQANAEETDKKVDADSLDEPESQPSESQANAEETDKKGKGKK